MELQATILGNLTVLISESPILPFQFEVTKILSPAIDQVHIVLPGDGGAPPSPRHPCSDQTLPSQVAGYTRLIIQIAD